jgi:hypothetical protein
VTTDPSTRLEHPSVIDRSLLLTATVAPFFGIVFGRTSTWAIVFPVAPIWLVVVGTVFSVVNAMAEQFVLKGIAWNWLELVFKCEWQVNASQAALFGIIHMEGFPKGWVGVLMATRYGLVHGIIREASDRLIAAMVANVCADASFFLVISFISAGVWSVA